MQRSFQLLSPPWQHYRTVSVPGPPASHVGRAKESVLEACTRPQWTRRCDRVHHNHEFASASFKGTGVNNTNEPQRKLLSEQ